MFQLLKKIFSGVRAGFKARTLQVVSEDEQRARLAVCLFGGPDNSHCPCVTAANTQLQRAATTVAKATVPASRQGLVHPSLVCDVCDCSLCLLSVTKPAGLRDHLKHLDEEYDRPDFCWLRRVKRESENKG